MKALYFQNNELRLIEVVKPVPQENEVLIRPLYTGICNTDLEILKGYMNFQGIIGHEFVGVVDESENPELSGKMVVGEINLACGNCAFCAKGLGNHCPNRTVLGIQGKDGAMADYLSLPEHNVHLIPNGIDPRMAVFVEPLAAACQIPEQLPIRPDDEVLLLGDGKLAQLIARVISRYTGNLTVVGKHPSKINLLKQHKIRVYPLEQFKSEPGSYQVVIEATGNREGWEMALEMVMPRGFLVLKSTYAGKHPLNPSPLVINEITLIGSRCGPFPQAIQLLKENLVDPTDLISDVYPFSEWEQAMERAQHPDALKILLKH